MVTARASRTPCATVTVAATTGSVPRAVGAKMLVYLTGEPLGTIGGGKLEALALLVAKEAIRSGKSGLQTYPLREDEPASFGAICGGEVTLFIEPVSRREALFLAGAGHCARAIAKLGTECDLHVTVIDEREDELALCSAAHAKIASSPVSFIRSREWESDEALILVSRHFQEDQEALFAALSGPALGYLGMIGSRRKILHVFDEMCRRGIKSERLAQVYAPMGLDIGADSPSEIAVSVLAEVMAVLRGRTGKHLRPKLFSAAERADSTQPL